VLSSGLEYTLWDVRKRAAVPISEKLTRESQPVLTSDGRYAAARDSRVIDLRNGRAIFTTNRKVLAVTRSGFAATGEFGLVQIWRLATGELEARIRVSDDPAAASFSPDEREIAVAAGSRVETWPWRLDDQIADACRLISDNRAAAPWTSLAITPAYRETCTSRPQPR